MLIGTQNLSQKSIREGLQDLSLRSLMAMPFHLSLFLYLIFWISELRHSALAWSMYAIFPVCGIILIWQFKFAQHWLDTARTRWRILYAVHTWSISMAWGLTLGTAVYEHGLTSSTLTIFAMICCVGAASVPAFSFDLLIQFGFQAILIFPAIIAASFINDVNSGTLIVGFVFYMLFMWTAGFSLFRFQRSLLIATELVDKQKLDIETAHTNLTTVHDLMETMLESIDEAFLTFDTSGRCSGQISEKSKMVLGIDPTGKSLAEILTDDSLKRSKIASWIQVIFGQPHLIDSLLEMAQKTMVRRTDEHLIRLSFHALYTTTGELSGLVLTAIDANREVTAQKTAVEAKERAELILRICDNRPDFRNLIERCGSLIRTMREPTTPLAEIREELHTVKGGFAIYGALDFSREVHACELYLREHEDSSDPLIMREAATTLQKCFDQWQQDKTKLFAKIGLFGESHLEVSKSKLAGLANKYRSDAKKLHLFQEISAQLATTDFGDILEDFTSHVEGISAKLGKQTEFILHRPSDSVPISPAFREVTRTFVHLFNNAIDHGIETPEERRLSGKPERGTINVTYDRATIDGKTWIRMLVRDDGRGINVDKIREIQRARGRVGTHQISDLDVAAFIFEPKLSTSTEISEVSGQGIGMGSVRTAVTKLGGQIWVSSTSLAGTSIEILLPYVDILQRAG